MKTLGISPKAYAPFIAIWGAILVSWIATGEFNRAEIAGAVASCIQLLTALASNPGDVVSEVPDDSQIDPDAGNPLEPTHFPPR